MWTVQIARSCPAYTSYKIPTQGLFHCEMMTRKRSAEAALTRKRSAEAAVTRKRSAEAAFPTLMKHQFSKASRTASPEQLYNQDIWSCIVSFLNARDLTNLALTSRFFVPIVLDDRVWKALSLRHLRIPEIAPLNTKFSWRSLYAAAFERSHSYSIHNREKNIDWMRIGAFTLVSNQAVAAGRLWQRSSVAKRRKTDENSALCLISNVKPGIWLADLHLLHCPVCNVPTCEGTMQTIDVRNWELFLHEEYQNGTWCFEEVATKHIQENCDAAAGGVFDYKRLIDKDNANSGVLNFKSWIGAPGDVQPRGKVSAFAAAACTKLLENQGLQVKFYIMKAGKDGPVVAIRITQQLV